MALRSLLAATVAMLLGGVFSSPAFGDNPPPNGSVEFEVSDTTAELGEDVMLTVTVLDVDGNPVANAACTISITDQPGSDASVAQDSAETDADGEITGELDVGGSLGNVVATAVCPAGVDPRDVRSARSTVVVAGTDGFAPPPASLPSTGFGSTGRDSGAGNTAAAMMIALIAVGAALTLLTANWAAARRTRRR